MRLDRFAQSFPGLIGNITTLEISKWLRGLNLSSRSLLNYRRIIVTLFRHAVDHGYLPEGVTQAEKVSKVKVNDEGEIGIFTPEEMTRLLETSGNEEMPYLALGAFAGIRTAEIVRLDWAEINFDSGYIEIKKAKAKTKGRRLIKMQPNLVEWLQLVKQESGPVLSLVRPDYTGPEVLAPKCDPPVVWKRNGLRHSFCSYRMVILQNEHQVSSEMGSSPAMVYANYRELVTKEAAEKWFAIVPSGKRQDRKSRAYLTRL